MLTLFYLSHIEVKMVYRTSTFRRKHLYSLKESLSVNQYIVLDIIMYHY